MNPTDLGTNVTRKTPSETSAEQAKLCIPPKKQSNPLNAYRSYTYNFTLAALKADALKNPDSYKLNSDYFVIAKSGGKGFTGIKQSSSFEYEKINSKKTEPSRGGLARDRNRKSFVEGLVQGFNKESPGRFDFYIDDVDVQSIISGNESTSLTTHTKLEFRVFEPYSMTGFIEALQVSSMSAGHANYIECPFLLKIEFRGYPDNLDISDPEIVPNTTRWIVFRFTGIDVAVDASGTSYVCKAVPFNEFVYGEASRLTKDISTTGSTAGELLTNFFKNLNTSNAEEAKLEGRDSRLFDEYEIFFPIKNQEGISVDYKNANYTPNDIFLSSMGEFLKTNTVYKFKDEADTSDSGLTPSNRLTSFSQGSDIPDIISSVIRDSEFGKNIISTQPDDRGFVPYFFIHSESEIKGHDQKTNRDYYKYKFLVIPYDMHYTRIIPRPNCVIDSCKLKDYVHREYNYIYTGKNVDLIKFNLQFNTLFFQAIPRGLGNLPTTPSASVGIQSNNPNTVKLKETCSGTGAAPIKPSADRSAPRPDGGNNAIAPQADPYTILARSMHKAILENVDQVTADIEIIGDPYYLFTGGSGNQEIKLAPEGTLENGEAPIYTGDVNILIKFKNPVDIDVDTGLAYFDNRVALYSGLFRVIEVNSKFKGGMFSQNLSLVRLPTQIEDTNQLPAEKFVSPIESAPDPIKESTPTPPEPTSTLRTSNDNLVSQIAEGSSITGLPGELSVLRPGDYGGLSGSRPGANTVGSFVNQTVSANVGAVNAFGAFINQVSGSIVSGLSNVDSAIRLSTAGLSAFSNNINQVGGTIREISKIANTIGFEKVNPTSLGQGMITAGLTTLDKAGVNVMSKIENLKNGASGLPSQVSSKLRKLNGDTEALAAQLGITPNTLAGLSSNLRTNVLGKINNAAALVPADVDVTKSVNDGLLLNNIPTRSLANIPPTQPRTVSPQPRINLSDIQTILDRGGSLENIPGTENVAGVNELLASVQVRPLSQYSGVDSSVISDKLVSIQSGLASITGKISSVESKVNSVALVASVTPPNVSSVSSSVVNKFGSASAKTSPLQSLINNRTLA
jgi:hypothetical protein